MSNVIKNWDNKTWLSSKDYIESFNKFLIKCIKLNSKSKILDIGCGRGKILGTLSSKLNLKNKPLGIDVVNHKNKDRRIKFKKVDVLTFFLKNEEKFDLILIKQTIHLLNISEIKKLLFLLKKKLNSKGKIIIFTLDTNKNELPTFKLMEKKLIKSLKKDKKILRLIKKIHPNMNKKKFIYKVKISKKKYLQMIKKKYISILLPLTTKEILEGLKDINLKYKNTIEFKDKLVCVILKT